MIKFLTNFKINILPQWSLALPLDFLSKKPFLSSLGRFRHQFLSHALESDQKKALPQILIKRRKYLKVIETPLEKWWSDCQLLITKAKNFGDQKLPFFLEIPKLWKETKIIQVSGTSKNSIENLMYQVFKKSSFFFSRVWGKPKCKNWKSVLFIIFEITKGEI